MDSAGALAQAEAIDRRRKAGQTVGRLQGLPVAVKDVLCARGEPTTCGSRMLEGFCPPYDATVVARLRGGRRRADRPDEHGRVRHGRIERELGVFPHAQSLGPLARAGRQQRRLGGRRGRADGAALRGQRHGRLDPLPRRAVRHHRVEADLRPREPLRPGGVRQQPRPGWADGPDRRGLRALLEVLAGHDPLDSTSIDQPVPRYTETVGEPLVGLRLGLVREHFGEGLDPEVEAAVREAACVYESLGATIEHVSLPHSRYAVATYYIIAPCEASGNLARYDGVRYGHRAGKGDSPHLCARGLLAPG